MAKARFAQDYDCVAVKLVVERVSAAGPAIASNAETNEATSAALSRSRKRDIRSWSVPSSRKAWRWFR